MLAVHWLLTKCKFCGIKELNIRDIKTTVTGDQCMTCIMRKATICICQNKDADQLRSTCEADQCLCFHYMDSTFPLLS